MLASFSLAEQVDFSCLEGLTLTDVRVDRDNQDIFFETDKEIFLMTHIQEVNEKVEIESITGELSDLIGSKILLAEEVTNQDNGTWTFYKLATIKGYVDIRWYGTSNGYYSEKVSLLRSEKPAQNQGDSLIMRSNNWLLWK